MALAITSSAQRFNEVMSQYDGLAQDETSMIMREIASPHSHITVRYNRGSYTAHTMLLSQPGTNTTHLLYALYDDVDLVVLYAPREVFDSKFANIALSFMREHYAGNVTKEDCKALLRR